MTIELSKGQGINLQKTAPSLKVVRVGLGWDVKPQRSGLDYDLDASVFICQLNATNQPKLIADEYFVFYNNKTSPDGAVVHSGDNRTGAGDGDDETILIDLSKIHPAAREISFIVTIHEADARGQSFGQVTNAYIRLYDDASGRLLAEYKLDTFQHETAVQFGSLFKLNEEWSFKAVGAGYKLGLADFVAGYQ